MSLLPLVLCFACRCRACYNIRTAASDVAQMLHWALLLCCHWACQYRYCACAVRIPRSCRHGHSQCTTPGTVRRTSRTAASCHHKVTEEQQSALPSRDRQRPASATAWRGASLHRPPQQQVRSQAVGPSHLVTLHMRQQQKAGGACIDAHHFTYCICPTLSLH